MPQDELPLRRHALSTAKRAYPGARRGRLIMASSQTKTKTHLESAHAGCYLKS